MKLLVASFHLEYELSGEAEGVRALVELFKSQNIQVSLLGYEKIPDSKHSRERIFSKLKNLFSIRKNIIKNSQDCDAILLFLPTPAFALFADIVAFKLDKPLIVRFDSHLVDGKFLASLKELFFDPGFYLPRFLINNSLVTRLSFKKARKYLVSSAWEKESLTGLGYHKDKLKVIPNLSRYQEVNLQSSDLKTSLDQKTIAYIGHFFGIKGVDILLEAFASIKTDAKLILAWSGLGSRSKIEKKIESFGLTKKVEICGKIEVPSFLKQIDLLVLPYLHTYGTAVYPNLVLESLSVGVPMITSDLPILKSLLLAPGREAAVLVEPGNPSKLSEAIDNLLNDPAKAQAMVENQNLLFQSELSASKVAQAYTTLFTELC